MRKPTIWVVHGFLKVLSDDPRSQPFCDFYREEREDRQEKTKRLRALCGLGGSNSQNFNHHHDSKKALLCCFLFGRNKNQ